MVIISLNSHSVKTSGVRCCGYSLHWPEIFQNSNIKSFLKLVFKFTYHAAQEVKPCRFIYEKTFSTFYQYSQSGAFYSWGQPSASNTSCDSAWPTERDPAEKCHLFPHHSTSHTSMCSLHLLTLPFHFYSKLSQHLSLSLSLSACSLCLYWFCGSVSSMLLALFDGGSEMESQSAKWNQSLFFFISLPPSVPSLRCNKRELHQLWTCVCEMSSLCSDCLPISVPFLLFLAPHCFLFPPHLPGLIQFDVFLCVTSKNKPIPAAFYFDRCILLWVSLFCVSTSKYFFYVF